MKKGRVEAFSDGVLAIILTIMVLELKVPEGAEWHNLFELMPKFLSYILSFLMVLIYWNNHHHVFQTVEKVNCNILLSNGLLLFFLSLLPFATAWMGENHFKSNPVALMGIILFLSAVAYTILSKSIIKSHGQDSTLAKAVGKDIKGKVSVLLYVIAIALAFFMPYISAGIYLLIAIIWLIPDKRIEKKIN